MKAVLYLLASLSLGYTCYTAGKVDQRRANLFSYQDGMKAGIKLGCAARGKGL